MLILALFLSLNGLVVKAVQIAPYAQFIECDGSFNVLTRTQTSKKILALSLGLWVNPGDSYEVTTSMTQTVSNSATFNLVPEFFSLGYEVSYTSAIAVGLTVTNTSSTLKEAALFRIADVYSVTMFTYVGANTCQILNTTKTVYKGYNYSFKD